MLTMSRFVPVLALIPALLASGASPALADGKGFKMGVSLSTVPDDQPLPPGLNLPTVERVYGKGAKNNLGGECITQEPGTKSVFIVGKKVKGLDEDELKIRCRQIPSVELRFYTPLQEHARRGLFFDVIAHYTDKPDRLVSHEAAQAVKHRVVSQYDSSARLYKVHLPNGNTIERGGVNYDDYHYSMGNLHTRFNTMWGSMKTKAEVWGYMAAGGALVAQYGLAMYLDRQEWGLVSAAASRVVGLVGLSTATVEGAKGARKLKAVLKKPHINLFDLIILGGLAYGQFHYLKKWVTNMKTKKYFGDEEMELDYLERTIPAAYQNATRGKPIGDLGTDFDSGVDRFHELGSSKPVDSDAAPKGDAGEEVAAPKIATLPTNDLQFAEKALYNFFVTYAQDNIEDGTAINPNKPK